METLRRLRTEKGLSQARLAARAEVDPSTVNQIERGAREASPATLRKLAAALDVGIADLLEDASPKAHRRSSLEPTFNDLEAERPSVVVDGMVGLLERRHARRLRQADDPNDPHFRDATAAATWIADVQEEANEVIRWILEHGEALAGTWEDLGMMAGVALFAENPVWIGKQRLKAMGEPDELAARRMEKTATAVQEARQELETAVNG